MMSKFIEKIMNDLEDTSRILKEAYVFDGEETPMNDEGDVQHGMMHGDDDVSPEMMHGVGGGEEESAEEEAMHAQEVIQHEPIIGKIREIAIEGLKKYADHPTSPAYGFFKKTFLEADKVITDDSKG